MRKMKNKQEHPGTTKRKLTSALVMLLVSAILMTTVSYAWFVLSTAPEVTGIETQVGANGSLEIVLLNTDTRADMSTIRAGLGGGSLQENQIAANNAWGNLVDLGYADYGLGELVLLPARLDTGDGVAVDLNKLLAVPTYGYDGRIIKLTSDTASAVYQDTGFLYSGAQDYGVRAIGTSDALSPQGSALASAKTNISTYTKSARSNTQATLNENGMGLFNIVLNYTTGSDFNDDHKATMNAMLTDLDGVLNYLNLSLRQGLVAYAAAEINDEDSFALVRDRILNTATPLADLLADLNEVTEVPDGFEAWVAELADMQNDLNGALIQCEKLEGGTYTWEQIKPILTSILDVDHVYIEGSLIRDLDAEELMNKLGGEIEMTLAPGSGLFADIADFTDDYSIAVDASYVNVVMTTASAQNPAYLVGLLAAVNTLTPADGGENASALPLTATYGYAIDLAFRCNAAMPDLLLQTKGVQRVYNGGESEEDIESTNGSTQGGGSYMEFTSTDEDFTLEQRLALMDAIRVGFVDDTGNILGIAKLNVTGREVEDGFIKAPLYLYDYTFEQDDSGLILTMGERRLADNLITTLEQNVAKAVTVVVWLDGDIVDNTMVSATQAASLNGVLNLQFATSAELVPAVDGSMMEYSLDKSGLEAAIQTAAEIATAGQSNYTNVSWNNFISAYNRAVSVNDNDNAGTYEIRNAVSKLSETYASLQKVSTEAIDQKVQEIRGVMGDAGDGTGEVNYEKNMVDEGNGIYTTIYSDESWNALAGALYEAEALPDNASEDEINTALTALENAQKALTRQVFYAPYEYNGSIYYMAICEEDAADTYGRWYDANFKRILSEPMMLKLDAYAEPAVITQLGQEAWVPSDAAHITPDIAFLEEVYPELRDVEVLGVHWNTIDTALFTEMMSQTHYSEMTQLIYMAGNDPVLTSALSTECTDARNAAAALTAKWENNEKVTAAEAEATLTDLNDAIIALYAANVDPASTDNMTANQRILLTAAVNAAKAADGYRTNTALKTAVKTAGELLAADNASMSGANSALTALTAELKNAGVAYSSLSYKLPEGFGNGNIVYSVEYPGINLKLNGTSGTTTLGAKVLTADGVVITVSKQITVYDRADGVKITRAGSEIEALELTAGSSADITARLFWEEGGINTGDKALAQIVEEEVKSVKWASSDTAVATVNGSETCTVSAVGAGTATISVSVETAAGNYYTLELPLTVSGPNP